MRWRATRLACFVTASSKSARCQDRGRGHRRGAGRRQRRHCFSGNACLQTGRRSCREERRGRLVGRMAEPDGSDGGILNYDARRAMRTMGQRGRCNPDQERAGKSAITRLPRFKMRDGLRSNRWSGIALRDQAARVRCLRIRFCLGPPRRDDRNEARVVVTLGALIGRG